MERVCDLWFRFMEPQRPLPARCGFELCLAVLRQGLAAIKDIFLAAFVGLRDPHDLSHARPPLGLHLSGSEHLEHSLSRAASSGLLCLSEAFGRASAPPAKQGWPLGTSVPLLGDPAGLQTRHNAAQVTAGLVDPGLRGDGRCRTAGVSSEHPRDSPPLCSTRGTSCSSRRHRVGTPLSPAAPVPASSSAAAAPSAPFSPSFGSSWVSPSFGGVPARRAAAPSPSMGHLPPNNALGRGQVGGTSPGMGGGPPAPRACGPQAPGCRQRCPGSPCPCPRVTGGQNLRSPGAATGAAPGPLVPSQGNALLPGHPALSPGCPGPPVPGAEPGLTPGTPRHSREAGGSESRHFPFPRPRWGGRAGLGGARGERGTQRGPRAAGGTVRGEHPAEGGRKTGEAERSCWAGVSRRGGLRRGGGGRCRGGFRPGPFCRAPAEAEVAAGAGWRSRRCS